MDINVKTGKAGVFIENVAGCGRFQTIVTVCVYFLANSASSFTMIFMAFANYNPGWRCNDVVLSNDSFTPITNNMSLNGGQIQNYNRVAPPTIENISISIIAFEQANYYNYNATDTISKIDIASSLEYSTAENCPLFESCKHIEFDPTSSTIVSEWELLCDKRWVPSFIASIQMAGVFIGSLMAGHVGDAFGRKPVIYGSVLATAGLNFVSIFSVSWEMLATIRFILGITCSHVICLYYVFSAEFVPEKWRSVLQGIPAWKCSTLVWSLLCMGLKNWRHIQMATSVLGIVGFIPVLWIPESLRWLETKNKTEAFKHAAYKIAKTNGKNLPSLETLQEIANSRDQQNDVSSKNTIYSNIHLFKKGYAKYTLLMIIPWFSMNFINYALKFGIKSLQGDFYINLMVTPIISVPFSILPIILPNLLGRKVTALLFGVLVTSCLLAAAILEFVADTSESVKSIAIPALVFTTKVCLDGVWCPLALFTVELYPTVIRGIAMSWGMAMSRVGSILAPFVSQDQFYDASISYLVLASIMFISCGMILGLPETKGAPLKDTLGKCDDVDDNRDYHYDDDETEIGIALQT